MLASRPRAAEGGQSGIVGGCFAGAGNDKCRRRGLFCVAFLRIFHVSCHVYLTRYGIMETGMECPIVSWFALSGK